MCGRYARVTRLNLFREKLGYEPGHEPPDGPNYNAHPGVFQFIRTTLRGEPVNDDPFFIRGRWGFMPSSARDVKRSWKNAQSETALEKSLWRKAFHVRRCVIPADWWYEWQEQGDEPKQPFAIRTKDSNGFFFAGIWSVARSLPPEHLNAGASTFAILTAAPHPDIEHIHHRMPVALTDQGAQSWLADGTDTADLRERLINGRYDGYESWPISTEVNSPKNNKPSVAEPI